MIIKSMLKTHCDQYFVPGIDIGFWGLQACLLCQQMKKVFICSAWPSGGYDRNARRLQEHTRAIEQTKHKTLIACCKNTNVGDYSTI